MKVVNKAVKTVKQSKMFTVYSLRLVFRCLVFLFIAALYLFRRDVLVAFVAPGFFSSVGLREVLWIILMSGMLLHILPFKITMSGLKSRRFTYSEPPEGYEIGDMYQYVQTMNKKAWQVILIWLLFNSVFALLYLLRVITEAEMLLLSCFYYLSDLICMLIYCPFQSHIMKNRCCVNCRIFDWGHFMMYTPMLFIKSFFSWSLFFTACIVLLRWEYVYISHPERFWNGSNASIRCENCKDKLCHVKHPLRDLYRNIKLKIQ